MIAVPPQLFVIRVNDRHDNEIKYPMYVPPLTLRLERSIYSPDAALSFAGITLPIPYRHDSNNFKYSITKWLTLDDVTSDYLVFEKSKFKLEFFLANHLIFLIVMSNVFSFFFFLGFSLMLDFLMTSSTKSVKILVF